MRSLILIVMLLSGCAWTPRIIGPYPDGLTIVQVDQWTLDIVCSKTSDSGLPVKQVLGCYDRAFDVVYVRADCDGAKALTHELGHRQGIAKPSESGFDW